MSENRVSRRSFLKVSGLTTLALALDWRRIKAYAAKVGDTRKYPCVVIGSGLGGLCCAAYLARQGFPVTVVERHDRPGGYATSFNRGRFNFEVSLHGTCINKSAHSAAARILSNVGVLDQLDLVLLPEIYRLKSPKLDMVVPQQDPAAFASLLSDHFPREASGIRSFVDEMTGLSEEVQRLYEKDGKFFKLLFPLQYRKMWNIRNKTLAEMLNEHVRDPEAQTALTSLWGYYGLPPSKLSAFFYANATGEYLRNGSFYIRNRSQDLSNALASQIESNGGQVHYRAPAEKILVKDGAVRGVVLAGGEEVPAKVVVSNASALTTFGTMIQKEAVPADYFEKLKGYKPGISTFIVWLGLKEELRGKIRGCGIYVNSGRGAEADYLSAVKGEVDKGSYGVSIYDNIFEGYSRPGTSSLMLLFLCGYEPWRRFEADYEAGRKTAYREEKDRWTEILIRRVEQEVVPGLSSKIEVKVAATPLTNRRFTGNTDGTIYGFEQSMDNAFMNRIENRTPVKGLYLASAWGNPGGGFGGVLRGGEKTFEAIMADLA
jgi:all-trans-retinol 13,14-reductase